MNFADPKLLEPKLPFRLFRSNVPAIAQGKWSRALLGSNHMLSVAGARTATLPFACEPLGGRKFDVMSSPALSLGDSAGVKSNG